MKVIMIEATAEELKANRTILDSITDTLSAFSQSLVGISLSKASVINALADMSEDNAEEQTDEE